MESICEEKNFKKVYDTYSEDLFRFMYYKFSNIEKAEDAVQESFVKLWDNCSKIIFEKVKSFLFTVSNNLFINEVRRDKIALKYINEPFQSFTNETPDYLMEENEFRQKLESAIQSLNSKQREVFLMHRVEKKKQKEIAEILNISVKAVEKRMGLAMLSLRNKIDGI